MAGDAPSAAEYERRISGLEALVAQQSAVIEAQRELIARLESRVAELERQLGQNSGNSGLPSSRDPAAERKRQSEERERRKQSQGAKRRRPGKQTGSAGAGPQMSATPDEVIDHRPAECGGCGADLDVRPDAGLRARQVVELPKVTPVVTEHRAHARQCSCGHVTVASFPEGVRAPVSYGPRVRATVAYLLGRQHRQAQIRRARGSVHLVRSGLLWCFPVWRNNAHPSPSLPQEAPSRLRARHPHLLPHRQRGPLPGRCH